MAGCPNRRRRVSAGPTGDLFVGGPDSTIGKVDARGRAVPGFAGGGRARLPQLTHCEQFANQPEVLALAATPDGDVIVLADSPESPNLAGGGCTPALIRFTPSGDLDRTFGTSGVALVWPTSTSALFYPYGQGLVVDPLGGVFATVESPLGPAGGDAEGVVRFNPGGSLDERWGQRGLASVDGFGPPAIALTPDGVSRSRPNDGQSTTPSARTWSSG